jgi:hypothetical protein
MATASGAHTTAQDIALAMQAARCCASRRRP